MLQSPPVLEVEPGEDRDQQRSPEVDDVSATGPNRNKRREQERTSIYSDLDLDDSEGKLVTILAGRLFDSEERIFRTDQALVVDPRAGIIVDVRPINQDDIQKLFELKLESANLMEGNIIDLRKQTVLPGFVDVHVHCAYSFSAFIWSA